MLLVDVYTNLLSRPQFPEKVDGLPSIYDYKIEDPKNPELDLQKYRGKKLIIVNTASACSFTRQYADMHRLYKAQKDKLNILAFPCNDFGHQEMLSNIEIRDFCTYNFHIQFPVFNKINIKGTEPSLLYYWLRMPSLNGWNGRRPAWNFWKYILNEKGQLVAVIPSKYLLTEENLIKWKI